MGWFNVISNSQTCRQFILFYYSFGAKILLTQENNNGHCTRGKVGDSHFISYYSYYININSHSYNTGKLQYVGREIKDSLSLSS